jgi:integration host factor subunit alpha
MNLNLENKDRLVDIISKTVKISLTKSEESVDSILNCMKQGLNKDGSLTIRKFGYFNTKNKKERAGRNPKTGEPAVITARRVVTFSPSKTLKQEVNK